MKCWKRHVATACGGEVTSRREHGRFVRRGATSVRGRRGLTVPDGEGASLSVSEPLVWPRNAKIAAANLPKMAKPMPPRTGTSVSVAGGAG